MSSAISTLEPEWSVLRVACSCGTPEEKQNRIRELLSVPIRWKVLFDLADRHGVQPLLCQGLSQSEDAVPAGELRTLKQRCEINAHKALFLSRELIRIIDHLSALGVEVMPYKGLALSEAIYGDIALRQTGDIDLLVRPRDLIRTKKAVQDLGYTPHSLLSKVQERAYFKSGYEWAFDGAAGPNLLELQWAIQPRFYAVDFEVDGLFRRATALEVAGHRMKTPSVEDLFLVLSLHAAKHVWGRLIWLCDLARIGALPTLDWNWIGSQATELGIVRILRVTLLLSSRLLGATIPQEAELPLPPDSAVSQLAEDIRVHIASERAYDVESIAYFRLMLRLRERMADRLRFLTRLAFTPGPGEWAVIRLPQPLFPLYRLVRLSRLAAKVVGG